MTIDGPRNAQMLAMSAPPVVFVPNRGGISHNTSRSTQSGDLAASVGVLLHVLLDHKRDLDSEMARRVES